jgi:hypothetical protein
MRPSGAKALLILDAFMYGLEARTLQLKPVPFN